MVGQRYSHLNGCTSDDIADDLLMQIRKSGSMGHFQLDYTDCTEVRGQYFLFSTLTSWHSLSAETIYRNRFCEETMPTTLQNQFMDRCISLHIPCYYICSIFPSASSHCEGSLDGEITL